jgi:hypothetical protein
MTGALWQPAPMTHGDGLTRLRLKRPRLARTAILDVEMFEWNMVSPRLNVGADGPEVLQLV